MKKEIRKMMQISAIISSILLITAIISFIYLIKIFSSTHFRVMIYIIVVTLVFLIFIWIVSLKLARTNRAGKAKGFSIYVLKAGINILLPIYICLTGLFKGDKDDIRRLYININNLVVRHNFQKNCLSKILMLLPGCMQNKDCSCKITEDIRNCHRCGGYKIGEMANLIEKCDIRTIVVKGGQLPEISLRNSSRTLYLLLHVKESF